MSADYRKMDQKDMDFLRSVCSPERVTAQGAISEDYWHDELGGIKREPEALVKVLLTREVSEDSRDSARTGDGACRRIRGTPRRNHAGLLRDESFP